MQHFWTYDLPQALEAWMENPRAMHSSAAANVRRDRIRRGLECVSIRHPILDGVDSAMAYWWFRYFCYLNVRLASGELIPAFVLWHPLDHVSFAIQRHSLSGAVGLGAGTQISVATKYRSLFLTVGVGIVQALDQTGLSVRFQRFLSGPALVLDDFVDTPTGLLYVSRLISADNRVRPLKQLNLDDDIVKDWIEYKIQVIENLRILLPILYKSQSPKIF